jgi:hypothetical protein
VFSYLLRRGRNRLSSLSLRGCGLTAADARLIGDELAFCPLPPPAPAAAQSQPGQQQQQQPLPEGDACVPLQSLNLACNRIGNAGLEALCRGLRENRSLTSLSLANNGIGSPVVLANLIPALTAFQLTAAEATERAAWEAKMAPVLVAEDAQIAAAVAARMAALPSAGGAGGKDKGKDKAKEKDKGKDKDKGAAGPVPEGYRLPALTQIVVASPPGSEANTNRSRASSVAAPPAANAPPAPSGKKGAAAAADAVPVFEEGSLYKGTGTLSLVTLDLAANNGIGAAAMHTLADALATAVESSAAALTEATAAALAAPPSPSKGGQPPKKGAAAAGPTPEAAASGPVPSRPSLKTLCGLHTWVKPLAVEQTPIEGEDSDEDAEVAAGTRDRRIRLRVRQASNEEMDRDQAQADRQHQLMSEAKHRLASVDIAFIY